MLWMLLVGETRQVRFWFAIVSFMFGLETISTGFVEGNPLLLALATDEIWRMAFFLHGVSVMYGVITKQYSKPLLLIEGVLGTAMYGALGIGDLLYFHTASPTIFCSVVAMYLLIRYPTHYTSNVEVSNE